ncbi:hypothetical protein GQ53DRAFT_261492 [Thozetella sp. PMI_491]|nr:hypothetical protein GQ53DRAFT_261492 [Thozetella sp. PMI_491]
MLHRWLQTGSFSEQKRRLGGPQLQAILERGTKEQLAAPHLQHSGSDLQHSVWGAGAGSGRVASIIDPRKERVWLAWHSALFYLLPALLANFHVGPLYEPQASSGSGGEVNQPSPRQMTWHARIERRWLWLPVCASEHDTSPPTNVHTYCTLE